MNAACFLIPKSHVAYLTEGSSLRQSMEKLRCQGNQVTLHILQPVTADHREQSDGEEGCA